MKLEDAKVFVCPHCRKALRLESARTGTNGEIVEGALICSTCEKNYPVACSIPRFVKRGHYATSFGDQWLRFAHVQTGPDAMPHNRLRFYATTQWPDELRGQTVLEAGCGAGRFSPIPLEAGAVLYSFDLSDAVEACQNTVSKTDHAEHHLFQADLYAIPLPFEMFDKIFCLGVLQHCPNVKGAFLGLIPFLKPGGEIVIDCYWRQPQKDLFTLKYWLRPFFKWWKPKTLMSFWGVVIRIAYNLKSILAKIPVLGRPLAGCVPIGMLQADMDRPISKAELLESKTLSVVDMLSPKYDQPQTLATFDAWARGAGLEIIDLTLGYNGINLRARRPFSSPIAN